MHWNWKMKGNRNVMEVQVRLVGLDILKGPLSSPTRLGTPVPSMPNSNDSASQKDGQGQPCLQQWRCGSWGALIRWGAIVTCY